VLLAIDLLDEEDPFEIDEQAAHLFKHAPYGIEDVYECGKRIPSSTLRSRRPTG
jgi:hypothetical protein